MRKLYYEDPYKKQFDAVVLSCETGKEDSFWITLDQTVFYPEGGGQPADTGVLTFQGENGEEKVSVLFTKESGETVLHQTKTAIPAGTCVHGVIDWDARFMRMQEHSGEHIISGLLHSKYGFNNVGFHMGSDEVTLDVDGELSMEELLEIEREANRIAAENRPIRCYYPSKEELDALDYRSKKELTGAVRIVEVPGADLCACCGIHVERTGEIGMIKLVGMIHYKGGMRISMLCGDRAREDYEKKLRQTQKISVLLSAKPQAVVEAVERQKELLEEKNRELAALFSQWMELKIQTTEKREMLLVREDALSTVQLRQYCDALVKAQKGVCVLALKKKEDGAFQYVLGSGTQDMRALGKCLNEKLAGNGGGSRQMVQGMFGKEYEKIKDEFEQNECFSMFKEGVAE